MEVYYSGNFGERSGHEKAGTMIPVGTSFQYAGYEWMVPTVYSFKEGMIIDVLRKIPMAQVKAFYDKWGVTDRNMSKFEREKSESENPLNCSVNFEACINNRKTRADRWSGTAFHSIKEMFCEAEAQEWMEAYELDPGFAWYCCRVRFSWPDKPETIDTLSLTLQTRPESLPCEGSFECHIGCQPFDVSFLHPVTGRDFKVHITSCKHEQMDRSLLPAQMMNQYLLFPEHYLFLRYYVDLDSAAEGRVHISDCSNGDLPVIKKGGKSRNAAIGVIGGAGGPTAISMLTEQENELEEIQLEQACSALYFKSIRSVNWCVSVQMPADTPIIIDLI